MKLSDVKVKQTMGSEVTLHVIKPNGKRIKVAEKVHNLITDFGMRRIGEQLLKEICVPSASGQVNCNWGDDGTSNTVDSGSITASMSGNAVSSSSGIFTVDMEGDLLKFDSGEEIYLQTYNSPTSFTSSDSATITSSEFTVYDVDRLSLGNERQTTQNLNAASTYTLSAGVVKGTAVFIFGSVASAGTVREIGWEPRGQSSIAARVVVPDIPLSIGDQLEVTTEFSLIQGYQTATAIDPTQDEGDFTGEVQVENPAIFGIGNSSNMEPYIAGQGAFSNEGHAFVSYGSKQRHTIIDSLETPSLSAAPTSPPWQRVRTFNFSTSESNGTGNLRSFIIGTGGNSSDQDAGLKFLFDTPQTKTNLQTCVVAIPFSWDRNLTN